MLPRRLPLRELAAGTELWRIHPADRGPLWFGPAPDSQLCIALFDRAADALAGPVPPIPLNTPSLLRPLLRRYGISLV